MLHMLCIYGQEQLLYVSERFVMPDPYVKDCAVCELKKEFSVFIFSFTFFMITSIYGEGNVSILCIHYVSLLKVLL